MNAVRVIKHASNSTHQVAFPSSPSHGLACSAASVSKLPIPWPCPLCGQRLKAGHLCCFKITNTRSRESSSGGRDLRHLWIPTCVTHTPAPVTASDSPVARGLIPRTPGRSPKSGAFCHQQTWDQHGNFAACREVFGEVSGCIPHTALRPPQDFSSTSPKAGRGCLMPCAATLS